MKMKFWAGHSELYSVWEEQPKVEEVRGPMLASQSMEAMHCMGEGVLLQPQKMRLGLRSRAWLPSLYRRRAIVYRYGRRCSFHGALQEFEQTLRLAFKGTASLRDKFIRVETLITNLGTPA